MQASATALGNTREDWLHLLLESLRPLFAEVGSALPAEVRVSCGWPVAGGVPKPGSKSRTIGQCWSRGCSADAHNEVFISPYLSDAAKVAATLVHELCHAALDCEGGHGAPFKRLASAVGLEGKPTATHAGPQLEQRLNALCRQLGEYPHATLDIASRPRQGTRLLKCICPGCGYTARITRQWIKQGLPTCPCGEEFIEAEKEEEDEDQ